MLTDVSYCNIMAKMLYGCGIMFAMLLPYSLKCVINVG